MSVDLAEFLTAYVAEVEEHLANANQKLLALEAAGRTGAPNPLAVREVFRSLHTIKGVSAMVAVEPIVAISHRVETALRAADDGSGMLPTPVVDLLLQAVSAIEERIRDVAAGRQVAPAPRGLLAGLDRLDDQPAEDPDVASVGATSALDALPADKLGAGERGILEGAAAVGKRARRLAFIPSPGARRPPG